jgi:hypothetical protein
MEFNFIKNIEERDKDLFFGPLKSEDNFFIIEENWTMANIVVKCNIFKSLSQARKNNWGYKIPEGFTDIFIGKLKNRITILNFKSSVVRSPC